LAVDLFNDWELTPPKSKLARLEDLENKSRSEELERQGERWGIGCCG